LEIILLFKWSGGCFRFLNIRRMLMQLSPLAMRALFKAMRVHATLTADGERGGGSFELLGLGMMSFLMRPGNKPDVFDVEVEDIRIDFDETGLDVAGMAIRFPRFTITRCDLDLTQTKGSWYRENSRLRLQVAIRLDPLHFPFMREMGFHEPVTVLVTESGTLKYPKPRVLDTHAEPTRLPPPLEFLTLSAGQWDVCEVGAELWVAIDCKWAKEIKGTEVWICPGEQACLLWESHNATTVNLNPVGSVSAGGNLLVSPPATTTYVLEATDGDCKETKQVTVRVVRKGENTYTLSADWNPWSSCLWRVEVPQALWGSAVMVQRMRHVLCSGGQSTWPQWGYRHTTDSGAVFTGNVEVNNWRDIPDQPVAGVWEFSPVGVTICNPPEGSRGWEPACFELELGCRK
jgi:hypothetical protein